MILNKFLNVTFNLSYNECLIFESLLKNGVLPASRVAKLVNMPRNTTRGILEKLTTVGICSKTQKENTFLYSVEKKSVILKTLERKRQESLEDWNFKIKEVESKGGIFDTTNSNVRPKVKLYEGEEGIKKVYEDTLESKETLRSWGSFDVNQSTFPRYFKTYYKRRTKRNIKMRSVHPYSKLANEHMKRNCQELREGIVIKNKDYFWTPEIQVYENKVNIVSWQEKFALLIESKEIADAFKVIFELSYLGVNYTNSID